MQQDRREAKDVVAARSERPEPYDAQWRKAEPSLVWSEAIAVPEADDGPDQRRVRSARQRRRGTRTHCMTILLLPPVPLELSMQATRRTFSLPRIGAILNGCEPRTTV